jgi:hypothetical protein
MTGSPKRRRPGFAARCLAAVVRFYQLGISPLLGPSCRFAPTCSEYAREALTEHGAWRGGWLALRRLLRCNPFCEGGYDPVPAPRRRPSEQDHANSVTSTAAGATTTADLGDTLNAPANAPSATAINSAAGPGSPAAGPSGAAAASASVVSFNQEAGECLC